MKIEVAVFDTHKMAVDALNKLKQNGISLKHVSLLSRAIKDEDDNLHLKNVITPDKMPLAVGASAGTLVGLLTGIGVFAIPGFGFLYGAGAIIGAIAGFDIGVITGGIGTLLTTAELDEKKLDEYENALKEDKIMLLIKVDNNEAEKVKQILLENGEHFKMI